MGLAVDLGYAYPEPNLFQRLVQGFAASRLGSRLTPRTLVPLDRLTARLTSGRLSLPMVLAGLPVLDLVTVGRRSGLARATHVIAVPYQDTLALLGTNFGQPTTPAWALNLEHHPEATVTYRALTRHVVARAATSSERASLMRNAEAAFRGTTRYEQRLHGVRTVRIFVLEPAVV